MATADSVKAKIQGLIDLSNSKTGQSNTDLTSAVNRLAEGYGQGGGDIAINGIIREYEVNAGASVSAGDFVEFVNKWGDNNIFDDSSNIKSVSACKLNNNTVFAVFTYLNNGAYYLYGIVAVIEGGSVDIGTAVKLDETKGFSHLSSVALTDSKVFIAYRRRNGDYHSGYGVVCDVEGTTITNGLPTSIGSSIVEEISAAALTDSKVFVVYRHGEYFGNALEYTAYAAVCTIEGGYISKGTAVSLGNYSSSGYYKGVSVVALTDRKAFISYRSPSSSGDSTYKMYGVVCTVEDMTIIKGSSRGLCSNDGYSDVFNYAIALAENKVFIAYRYFESPVDTIYGIVLTIEGTTISTGAAYTLASTVVSGNSDRFSYISAAALTDSKVFVAFCYYDGTTYYLNGVVCVIEGTTITNGTVQALDSGRVGLYGISAIAFSDSSVFVISAGSISTYLGETIEGDIITVNSTSEGIGTYVQPATSSLHNVGVAKTSGTAGQKVKVYCVGEPTVGTPTDLTGTTWYVPSGWSTCSGGPFNLEFKYSYTTSNGDTYGPYSKMTVIRVSGNSDISYIYFENDDSTISDCRNNTYSLTLSFTGGTDVTNANLIAWLATNGSQITASS